ncbi:MAG: FAD-binding protein [Acidobacteria bacterium]|nr:FAD-binding protein [Acidobacteriota bacterium]
MRQQGDPKLAARLRREIEGEVLFDAFSRGRYSTDASFYQIEPIGVVLPRHDRDLVVALQIAAERGVPVIARGGGTSQSGQSIGDGLIVDTSKYLTNISVDPRARRAVVEPGVVLDRLNAELQSHGLVFPVDVSTASQATIGGMAGNNSAGSRSIRYGIMVDNVAGLEVVLAGGERVVFGRLTQITHAEARATALASAVLRIYEREADELAARVPKVARNVAGYNLDRVGTGTHDLTPLLIGSEGTLGFFSRIDLILQELPAHRVLGVCHFPSLRSAMDATRHIVRLEPTAVELVDRTLIDLARSAPQFQRSIARFLIGEPEALLIVEFSGPDLGALETEIRRLRELMGTLGFSPSTCFVEALDTALQNEIWAVRSASLNIVMSMRGDRKPVSFIEDCAVPLEHLGDYIDGLLEIFRRHDTRGTFYAHASVGCLHVRPILNLKSEREVRAMRKVAEEAHAMVRAFKGSHSGEHGDGLVRSEFLEPMLGPRLTRAFGEIKDLFDPRGLLNPGKIVRPPRMDDRALFRYKPGYGSLPLQTALDWSEWGGLTGAVEMCNNNGACRKFDTGVMCPSYRVTLDEQHTTRGRANTLRLALTGQLGPAALTSEQMRETLELCVGCKACRRECPTGVDMARMKTEFLHHYHAAHGLPLGDRLVSYLPRYAAAASRVPWLLNARNQSRLLARAGERFLGLSAKRSLPAWRRDIFDERAMRLATRNSEPVSRNPQHETRDSQPATYAATAGPTDGPEAVLLVDTFSRYFEPENAQAAMRVLTAGGYRVILAAPADHGRPLCCGRTFLNAGLVDEAKVEAARLIDSLAPYVDRNVPIVGIEPSCLLTLRDEFLALLPGPAARALAQRAVLIEEFLNAEQNAGRLRLPLAGLSFTRALVHGHCHQKAFGVMPAVERTLRLIPGLRAETIESSCCGMAGSFGYRHVDVSMKMAELSLLPAVRRAGADTLVVASGTSCRRQILDGAGREALHPVRVLDLALGTSAGFGLLGFGLGALESRVTG